ncbi:MAG: hypothetical protein BWY56_00817 [Acidobacteria bacterium ADurb.Bin340]|nr:MAG: hypothetical protein BWY56_00817 [Acidobacteria bacterium ADurb.Bin340]HOD33203.1 hypothetical protein [Holophaga sp.]HQL47426.1 hypothetical protein [Holophaga sp.]
MKRVLFVFALVAVALGLVLAVTYAWNAPPLEEPLGGLVYSWNGPERREAFIKAWVCAGIGVSLGLIFSGLGCILDRLEALAKKG